MKRGVWVFGEVLFDHFPDGTRVLGGAPFNVAWHLQAFGQAPWFVSRVGADPEGAAVREAMRDWGMDTGGLQLDPRYPTGRVSVRFADGEPTYDIVRPCAYDAIEPVSVGSMVGFGAATTSAPSMRVAASTPWWTRPRWSIGKMRGGASLLA